MKTNICSDRCKQISSILLVTICLINLSFVVVIYLMTYVSIRDFEVHGGAQLPSLKINFDSFSFYILFSVILVVGLLVLGLSASWCKLPVFAFSYGLLAITSFILIIYTSSLALKYSLDGTKVCADAKDNVNKMSDDYQKLVNIYMCSSQCPCYWGDYSEIKRKWDLLEDSTLFPFLRNTGKTG